MSVLLLLTTTAVAPRPIEQLNKKTVVHSNRFSLAAGGTDAHFAAEHVSCILYSKNKRVDNINFTIQAISNVWPIDPWQRSRPLAYTCG